MSDSSNASAIDVTVKFFPLAFILFLLKPRVGVDGAEPAAVSWGTMRIPVAPGRHQLRAFVPYLFFRFMGDATVAVDVAPGQVVRATWSAPWLAFLPGKWTVAGAAAVAPVAQAMVGSASTTVGGPAATAPAAAWHPDPTGRHQMRYWDGATWTAHVSNAGVASVDPAG